MDSASKLSVFHKWVFCAVFSFSWCVQQGKSDKEVRKVSILKFWDLTIQWVEGDVKWEEFGPKLFTILTEKMILPEYWKCHFFNKVFFMLCYQIKGEDHLKCKLNVNVFFFSYTGFLNIYTAAVFLCISMISWAISKEQDQLRTSHSGLDCFTLNAAHCDQG